MEVHVVGTAVRSRSPTRPATFRIGGRRIFPASNEIDGSRIEAKSMDVLVALADAAPSVLSAPALLDRVWPGVVVVDNVVYRAIGQLRKALGDDARAPRFIENIPRRGYRLIAEIARAPTGDEINGAAELWVDTSPADTQTKSAVATRGGSPVVPPPRGRRPRMSVAVLPFRYSSTDPALAALATGLAYEIVQELSGPRLETFRRYSHMELKVVSARSTLRYQHSTEDLATIGRALRALYLVDGNLQASAEGVRTAVSLIRARDDELVWSHTYDESLQRHTLSAQSAIALDVAQHVARFINGHYWYQSIRPQFASAAAYEYFIKGCRGYHNGKSGNSVDWPAIVANLEKSLELEPTFLLTYELLAHAYLEQLEGSTQRVEMMAPINELLRRLRTLLGSDAELYAGFYDRAYASSIGARNYLCELDYVNADEQIREALRCSPNTVRALVTQGFLFLHHERVDDAIKSLRRAFFHAGGAQFPFVSVPLARTLRAHGEPSAALKIIERALELLPGNFGKGQLLVEQANAYLALGEYERAAANVDVAWEFCGTAHAQLFPAALAGTGRSQRACALLRELECAGNSRAVNPVDMIDGYLAVADLDGVFRWIDRGLRARFEPVVRWMHSTAALAGERSLAMLTGDPRWQRAYRSLPKTCLSHQHKRAAELTASITRET